MKLLTIIFKEENQSPWLLTEASVCPFNPHRNYPAYRNPIYKISTKELSRGLNIIAIKNAGRSPPL